MSTPFAALPTLSGYADTPNENPLSNGGRFVTVGATALQRSGGRIQPQAGGTEGYAVWVPQFFTDFAITWVIGDISGFSLDLRVRATADGETSYYEGHVDNASPGVSNYELRKRISGGTVSNLASNASGPDVETFDRIGIADVGTGLELWHQEHTGNPGDPDYGPTAIDDDSSWTQVITATDSDLTSGYFVLGLGGLVAAVYQASGAGVFPVGSAVGPASPSFNVHIRTLDA